MRRRRHGGLTKNARRREAPSPLLPRGQAMVEYSTILVFMLTVVVLISGTSVMKSMIEAISSYFQATYFAIQFPM